MASLKEKIQSLLKEQHKTQKDLCLAIGMTTMGLKGIYNRNSCELTTLRNMASFFEIPASDFLSEEEVRVKIHDNEGSFNNTNDSKAIEELTTIINEQRKRIDYLTDQLLKK